MIIVFFLSFLALNEASSSEERRLFYSEEREKCRSYNPLKKPLFGDVHVHTSRSLDAATQDVRTTPYQAYQFAKGKRIPLHPWAPLSKKGEVRIQNTYLKKGVSFDSLPTFEARSTRSIQLGRPLDFAMVSDHAEFFGELRVCGEAARDSKDGKSKVCKGLRKNFPAKGMKLVQDYSPGLM